MDSEFEAGAPFSNLDVEENVAGRYMNKDNFSWKLTKGCPKSARSDHASVEPDMAPLSEAVNIQYVSSSDEGVNTYRGHIDADWTIGA